MWLANRIYETVTAEEAGGVLNTAFMNAAGTAGAVHRFRTEEDLFSHIVGVVNVKRLCLKIYRYG
jgi:hypothetical protein